MDTVEKHSHSFAESEWPFSDSMNAVAISTTRVFREEYPILRVSHDEDGDWQVLCGTTTESEHAIVVCLGCAYARDKSIGELADMPRGWTAWCDYVGAAWEREMKESEDEES
jgi:hypothetical protein